jgi:hypothetical protein
MATKIYLLPCSCGADIPVSAGVAGGRASCPSCGRSVDVPKLRELSHLRARAAVQPNETRWSLAHALLLAGLAVAAISWAAAFALVPRAGAVVDREAIRAAAQAAADADIYKAWKQGFSRAGVARPPTEEEQRLLRTSRFSAGVSRVLQVLGGLGVLVAAAAAARAFAGRAGERGSARPPGGSP